MSPTTATVQVATMQLGTLARARLMTRTPGLPVIVASTGAGILGIGLADAASRADQPFALILFWLGFLAIAGPAAWRLVARTGPSATERLAIVVTVGLALYLVKVMISPTAFAFPDEFSHLRTLMDLQASGHLFQDNPLLPVSPIYPGLETATATLMATTGLDAVGAGYLLVGLAKMLLLISLFLLARSLTRSAHAAGIASLVYMANPSFLLFDATFSYESLALPLAITSIWATHRMVVLGRLSAPLSIVALGCATATVVTHHITSFFLITFLTAWSIVWLVRAPRRRGEAALGLVTGWTWVATAIWHVIAGPAVAAYLFPVISRGLLAVTQLLVGGADAKPLFAPLGGLAAPLPEIVAAYAAVASILLSLPLVLLYVLRHRRPTAIALVLCAGAVLYPPSLALRLTALGSETSQRMSEFVFLALAILGAAWLTGHGATRWRPTRPMAVSAILLVLIIGGIASGAPPLGRLPGPYRVAAESRSFEPQGVAAATWALEHLGPGHRIIADRTNAKLMGSIGLQHPVTSANEHLGTAWVVLASSLGPAQLEVLEQGAIDYVVVDRRLAQAPPIYPFYFEPAEPDAGRHLAPASLAALEKFDQDPRIHRVYDSGDIVIYDVRGLVDALR